MTRGFGYTAGQPRSDEWITPLFILDALGPFDLDPCASRSQPGQTAKRMMTVQEDGLSKGWDGRVWLNPPYSRPLLTAFVKRLSEHGNGTALIFARTETELFHDIVWPTATALLFLRGRLHFCRPDGQRAQHNSGAPSVLIAWGGYDAMKLSCSGLSGKLIMPNVRVLQQELFREGA